MNEQTNEEILAGVHSFRGSSQARAFALKGGSALDGLLYSIAKRKEEEGKGPIETMVFISDNFDEADVPVVGSKKGETGNKPYDKYSVPVKGPNGERQEPRSFYTEVVKDTNTWATLNQRREFCKQGQGEGVPADIIAMTPSERAMEAERIRKFIANMRTALTRGSMLLHQWIAVKTMNPDRVRVRMPVMEQKDKDGNPVNVVTGNLIRVYDPSGADDQEPEVLTVSQFLAWDVTKASAEKDGGTIASLKATATRAPKGAGQGKGKAGTGTAYVQPRTIGDLLTLFNVLASGLDNGTEEGRKMEAQLLTQCAKEGKDGDEATVSVGKVCMAADNVWTVISNRYNGIMAARAAVLNVKKAS